MVNSITSRLFFTSGNNLPSFSPIQAHTGQRPGKTHFTFSTYTQHTIPRHSMHTCPSQLKLVHSTSHASSMHNPHILQCLAEKPVHHWCIFARPFITHSEVPEPVSLLLRGWPVSVSVDSPVVIDSFSPVINSDRFVVAFYFHPLYKSRHCIRGSISGTRYR